MSGNEAVRIVLDEHGFVDRILHPKFIVRCDGLVVRGEEETYFIPELDWWANRCANHTRHLEEGHETPADCARVEGLEGREYFTNQLPRPGFEQAFEYETFKLMRRAVQLFTIGYGDTDARAGIVLMDEEWTLSIPSGLLRGSSRQVAQQIVERFGLKGVDEYSEDFPYCFAFRFHARRERSARELLAVREELARLLT